MDGQVTWSDLGFSFGRTLSEHTAATEEKTLQPCWKKLRVSQNQDFLYLDFRKSRNGQKQEPLTVMGGLSLGGLTTLRTGEKPSETAVQEMLSVWGPHSVAEESRLSQILEVNPLPKYNLTAKACLGILRRAERRGKDLPERLKQVLLMQSASGGGCDGGGKGALVQTEKSGTLGTGNDQTIFCLQGNGIDRADTAGCNGKGWKADESYTLNTIDRPAVCAEVSCLNPWDAQSARVYDQEGAWHKPECQRKRRHGAQAGGIGYSEEVSPTLAAEPSGTNQTPAVVALDMSHACDVIRECGEQAPALQARMGTGGNQVPLTYGIGNGQACEASIMAEEIAQTLNTMHDAQEVMCEDVSRALRAKANCAYREDTETYPVQNMVVRRLTPLECERLQGYPDGWTDIGEWVDEKGKRHKPSDSPRYKALGNSIALPFWEWMLRRMARYLPEGATLGSLFDGIGGFPLIWERIHGEGTARWASEIEQFPIAVTKIRFPEEREDGI